MILRGEAPAKINRELRVGERRDDGYHEVLSRIVSVDLTDTIEVTPGKGFLDFSCEGLAAPRDERNLVVQAAQRLAARLGIPPDARIRLEKRIPAGAGLGGGSSDAAAALLLLSNLWRDAAPLSERALAEVASELGSDVPYFLAGGEADVRGRGEKVSPREDGLPEDLVLFLPPFPLSTRDVYGSYDRLLPGGSPLPERMEIETSGRYFGPNDLASAVLETNREMGKILDDARKAAPEVTISGSGSAVVLRGAGINSMRSLREANPGARLVACRTMRRDEHRRRIGTSGGF